MSVFVWGKQDEKKVKCSSWFYINRNRSASLFIPVSSASDRADLHLQNYHKTYSQQVFSQQQGTDSAHQACHHHRLPQTNTMNSVLLLTFIICSMVFRGCVYGEGKVVQPVSEGGFEPTSYFTNPTAAHSPGRTACAPNKILVEWLKSARLPPLFSNLNNEFSHPEKHTHFRPWLASCAEFEKEGFELLFQALSFTFVTHKKPDPFLHEGKNRGYKTHQIPLKVKDLQNI